MMLEPNRTTPMFFDLFHKAISSRTCYHWAKLMQPWFALCAFLTFAYGLFVGLSVAPADYQQGDAFRILYLHVPAAIWSLTAYIIMAIAVVIHFIWQIKVADIVAKASAPIGATFTLLTLVTGAIWGKPTWGTWWIWDARLTSELILLFIYFGIIAIRSAIPEPRMAAQASGILTLVGVVNLPIIHFSVNWWNTLHQGATLSLTKATIAPSMLHPLLAMIVAFACYYGWILCIKIRSELLYRERQTTWVKQVLT